MNVIDDCPPSLDGNSRPVTTGGHATSKVSTREDLSGHPITAETLANWRREEPLLVSAWKDRNDERALALLLDRHQLLIRKEIRRIVAGRTISTSHHVDLEQEAALAFVKALSKFEVARGFQLATFAQTYIRNALLRYALDFRNSFRIGTSSPERKVFYAALALRARRLHAGESELLSKEDVERLQRRAGASRDAAQRAVAAVYARVTDPEEAEDVPCLDEDKEDVEADLARTAAMSVLSNLVEELDEREKAIFSQLAKKGSIDPKDLADQFGLTPDRIGQIRRGLLKRMESHLRANGIEASDVF